VSALPVPFWGVAVAGFVPVAGPAPAAAAAVAGGIAPAAAAAARLLRGGRRRRGGRLGLRGDAPLRVRLHARLELGRARSGARPAQLRRR
jgi:hypothetical protein